MSVAWDGKDRRGKVRVMPWWAAAPLFLAATGFWAYFIWAGTRLWKH